MGGESILETEYLYTFNNNFKQIIKLKNKIESNKFNYDSANEILLQEALRNYGVKRTVVTNMNKDESEQSRLNAIEQWLKFEFPDVKNYSDLVHCRYEKDELKRQCLKIINDSLVNKSERSSLENKNEQESIDDEVVKTDVIQKLVMIGIPASLISLIVLLVNTVS